MADLLASLEDTGLELYAYANQWIHDDLTDRLKPLFAAWCACNVLSDDAMAAQIRANGIDVLVDLSGHTAGGRPQVFARKPAPVQVTYLGYPDTTGLSAIDYILGDPRMFPPGEETLYTEKPWLLPDTSLCFTPPDLPVEVGPLPASQNGFVTFGCLNKAEKANNDSVIEVWAKVLHAVPGSRLLLQNKSYGDEGIAADMRNRYAAHGIGTERLDLIGKMTWREHMETYNRVDIALDPFPYNGTTTTIEGLWMGVPLLGLKGDRLVAHMGESILHTLRMPEWIATDLEDYVAKAAVLAGDLTCLSDVRANLRNRLLASPISDAPRFARNLEAAFRGMWRKWCEQQLI
jgi:predicted O-linked N-acetylglucosamine transferase (SPINDLY family)